MIRAAKVKQATLKLPAVKLPEDGDTDEDEEDDNDSVENEDIGMSKDIISGSERATTRGMAAVAEVGNPSKAGTEKGGGRVETRGSSSSL